ncbi:MAG: DEAD/DEAH box helicase, partial [Candidatus Neomarinimicrobiota bacterium]
MSAGSQLDLNTAVQFLKGVGPARGQALAAAGITNLSDLLYYFPRRHLDRTTVTPIKSIQRDTTATVVGTVQVCGERQARRRKFFQTVISDQTGLLTLVWFNGARYIKQALKVGTRLAVNGKIEFYNGFQIVHPEFDVLSETDDPLNTGAVIPLYPLTQGLKAARIDNRSLRRIIRGALDSLVEVPDLYQPTFRKKHGLVSLDEALRNIHYASDVDRLQGAARRLKFDEHFFLQLLMALRKVALQQAGAPAMDKTGTRLQLVYDQLDFELTEAQKRVVKEIRRDLAQPAAMNRLLQGDVGSGKTVVAVLAAAIAVGNGLQVAVMAPTEILAHQHYRSFKKYADAARMTCALL